MSGESTESGLGFLENQCTRREVLKGAALAGAALGLGPLLSACGGGTASPAGSISAAGSPRSGGTLRAALIGGSSSDTLDALNPITVVDFQRIFQLNQGLVAYTPDAQLSYVLADEMTPNADATEWTIRVKSGITFHDGKPFGADDVMYTLRRILDPKAPAAGAASIALLDVAKMKKLDDLTVRVPCTQPFCTLKEVMAAGYHLMVPVDYDPKKPLGTGPFQVVSFTPGRQSTFKKYADYWETGLPYVDEVVMTDFSDATSQMNALVGGQADLANALSADVIPTATGQGKKIVVNPGGGMTPFTMRVDSKPFDDVRVRQAMRLVVDRKQLMDLVFAGNGTIGNDVFSMWDPSYDSELPQREQDIEQAKSLLKAAGQEGMTVELVTADIAQGAIKAAQVFAQQAAAAGVTVKLRQTNVTDFYGSNYLKWVFAQDWWSFFYYLPQVAFSNLKIAPFNETHWDDPRTTKLYLEALSTVDDAKRTEIVHEMQKIDYDEGGYIIAYFSPVIDAYGANVSGQVISKSGYSFNYGALKDLWLS